MKRGLLRWVAFILLSLAAVAFVIDRNGSSKRPPNFAVDLGRLRTEDDLYTIPQLKAEEPLSLPDTAYVRGSLSNLGSEDERLSQKVIRRLLAGNDVTPETVMFRRLLADAGTGMPTVPEPRLKRLWLAATQQRPSPMAIQALDALALGAGGARSVVGRGRARVQVMLRSFSESSRGVRRLARVRLMAVAGLPPDPEAVRLARAPSIRGTTTLSRILFGSTVVWANVAAEKQPAPEIVTGLESAAAQSSNPEALWTATSALNAIKRSRVPLRSRIAVLTRQLDGRSGAVRQRAVFITAPKAVWLVAHMYRAAGYEAMTDRDKVALSQAIASTDGSYSEPGSRAALIAAGRLTGLTYDGNLGESVTPATEIASEEEALAWGDDARWATDLGQTVKEPKVRPWPFVDEVSVGSLGLVLTSADYAGVQVKLSKGVKAAFVESASRQVFRSSRAATWTSAGLVAIGRKDVAAKVVQPLRVGCGSFKYLVRDFGGTCDLEATWQVLELANDGIKPAQVLRKQIKGDQ